MASTTGNIGGLDFSQLITAVSNVSSTMSSVVTRLQNVAPQAGSTDAASSAAAQAEINTLADQLNAAVQSLNQVNQAAQQAASTQSTPPGGTAVSSPAPDVTGASPAAPSTPPAAPASPATTPAGPTETGANTPPPGGTTTPGA